MKEKNYNFLHPSLPPIKQPMFVDSFDQSPPPYLKKEKQSDPKGLDPKTPGAKRDYGKSPVYRGLLGYFPRACMAIADVSAKGAAIYSWKGWEKVDNGVQRYADAGARHIIYEVMEGPVDSETGCWHKAHKAWNALAELELFLREQEGKK